MGITLPAGSPGSRIVGVGHYRPKNIVTNLDLVARGVDTDDEWIKSRVGISERRWCDPEETLLDMGEAAASKALAAAGIGADDIDLVIMATCTMPLPIPQAAPNIASRLGIRAPGAYDISSGCSGFIYSLAAADAAIRAGQAHNVLVVASERFSDWIDIHDRTTSIILADGAGAAVVTASDTVGIGPVVWGSDGSQVDTIAIEPKTGYFRQEGQTIYRWVTTNMGAVALAACEKAGIAPSELAAFIPHQANLRIIDAMVKRLALPERVVIARDIVTTGNTSAASIPIAMSRMSEAGELPSGAPALIMGYGAGLAWAAQVILTP